MEYADYIVSQHSRSSVMQFSAIVKNEFIGETFRPFMDKIDADRNSNPSELWIKDSPKVHALKTGNIMTPSEHPLLEALEFIAAKQYSISTAPMPQPPLSGESMAWHLQYKQGNRSQHAIEAKRVSHICCTVRYSFAQSYW